MLAEVQFNLTNKKLLFPLPPLCGATGAAGSGTLIPLPPHCQVLRGSPSGTVPFVPYRKSPEQPFPCA